MTRSVVLLACALTVLTACGDGAANGNVSSTGAMSSSTVEVPTTAATTLVVAVQVHPCDLLSAEEVTAAAGLDVEEVSEDSPTSCIFDLGGEAGVDVFIATEDAQGRPGGPAALFAAYTASLTGGEAETVAGLGVGAVYAPGFRTLAVDAGGGVFLALGVNGGFQQLPEPREVLIRLAAEALRHL